MKNRNTQVVVEDDYDEQKRKEYKGSKSNTLVCFGNNRNAFSDCFYIKIRILILQSDYYV